MEYSEERISDLIREKLGTYCAASPSTASEEQMYKAVVIAVRDILINKKQEYNRKIQQRGLKRVYYLCMEFLLGRSLKNDLYNLGLTEQFSGALQSMGFSPERLFEIEADPGLGNGGLGRLAACFMDSLATLGYPAMGFSLLYEYGLFRQKIVENTQVELPDLWLDSGEVWLLPRSDKRFEVYLGGTVVESFRDGRLYFEYRDAEVVEAQAYDMMISGADSEGVSVLRLWRASAKRRFDMDSFSQGDYFAANRADNEAELISKVLYPSDEHREGKRLRLSQQYFLVSASLQSILKDHIKHYGTAHNFAEKAAVHINDTHPALAIPELMRLLMDEHGLGWDEAWNICVSAFAYTNHTVMSEALEQWGVDLVETLLPRIYMIIREIDRRFCAEMRAQGKTDAVLSRTAILWGRQARMANLCVIGSHSVNGVSELHSEILREAVFPDFCAVYPDKFTSVTNGIAHRRWLCQANPELAEFITSLIGDGFVRNPRELSRLNEYSSDKSVLMRLGEIKQHNKDALADWLMRTSGVRINPRSRFDVQIKRFHEYKRQLMNALKIIYFILKAEDGEADETPQTFIFGGKAAGGYMHAKRVIKLINCLSSHIRADKKLNRFIDVVFVENYNVTKAEKLIPAGEVSEQISLAGKEASGTSNMKFMLNGAITLGTVDGANVEIGESVGEENIFYFGLTAKEAAEEWKSGYNPSAAYSSDPTVKRVVARLKSGFAGESFADLAAYLTVGSASLADPYMCLKDLPSYIAAHRRMDATYSDVYAWNRISLANIAQAGRFAADCSIEEYARRIWRLEKVN